MRSRLQLTTALAAITLAAGVAAAQPRDHRDQRDGRDHRHDHDQPATPTAAGPTEAPPPPQAETPGTRDGFVWVAGRWDWKDGKWAWGAGHWERARAGKEWHPGHWDQHGAAWAYTEGAWADQTAATAPPTAPPPDGDHDHRHEWKLDRPVVSSYWPTKGKIGTRIVIRGRNFAADATVMWGGQPVRGAKVDPDRIVLVVPDGATSGDLALRRDQGHDLAIGSFEVAADVDAAAEQKRLDDEARTKAETDWAARQKELARDKAARQADFDQQEQQRDQTREQRRADRVAELRKRWEAAFLADPDTQAELTLHAQRGAAIARMRAVAELSDDGKLAVRIGVAEQKEEQRHDQRMAALHDAFGKKGGNP